VVVLGVRADPEPHDDVAFDDAKRAVAKPHPCGVNRAGRVHVFEAETSVLGILLEPSVGLTGPALNMIWEPSVGVAESPGRP
jgi:hypothetical protein